eukprot:1185119-Prorocentrum_minimum.AAC.2
MGSEGGSGGGPEGIYRSSLDARKPQNPTKSEEYQGHLQGPEGVRRGSGGGPEGVRRGAWAGGHHVRGVRVLCACAGSFAWLSELRTLHVF